jgi:hypothetical protein
MSQSHLVLLALIALSVVHLVSDGEATVKLIRKWQ